MNRWMDWLAPPARCCFCESPVSAPWGKGWKAVCASCRDQMEPIRAPFCFRCGRSEVRSLCADCQRWKRTNLEANRSVCVYNRYTRNRIWMFKYRGKEDWAEPMGQMMAECLQETGWRAQGITFVPLHPDRLAERGFNQAERLATVLAAWSKLPLYPVLERITPTTPQSRSNRHQRLVAMRGVFGVSPTFREPLPASLIVVDDVYTTGATLVDCARALAQAGVSRIRSVTFAR